MDRAAFSPSETSKQLQKKGREFAVLLGSFAELVKQLPGTEQHRADTIIREVAQEFHKVIASGDEPKRGLAVVREHLTELERLLSGQHMLFSSELRERVAARYRTALHEPVSQIFKELFNICDVVEETIEADRRLRQGERPSPTTPAKPRVKAPKTYKQAQDGILQALHQAGWRVVAHLKIPHATSPDGTFRFWFKPQAIYFSTNKSRGSWNFGDARSAWLQDYRFEEPSKFAKGLESFAVREQTRQNIAIESR
jgi:hypothetical protein